MRRAGDSGIPLRHPHVAQAAHPDLAVAPRLGGTPFNSIVAVRSLTLVGSPLALGIVAAATVLSHVNVTARGIEPADLIVSRRVVAVRSADKNYGKTALGIGPPKVGAEIHTVAHRDFYVRLVSD